MRAVPCRAALQFCVVCSLVTDVAFLFTPRSLFTFCMMCDQAQAVITGEGGIDRLKSDHEDGSEVRRSIKNNLLEVFGGRHFSLSWLLPTPISYPDPEKLTGYCFRDVPRPRTLKELETI